MQFIPTQVRELLKTKAMTGTAAPRAVVTFKLPPSLWGQGVIMFDPQATTLRGLGFHFPTRRIFAGEPLNDRILILNPQGVQLDSITLDDFPVGCEVDADDSDLLWTIHPQATGSPGIKQWSISRKQKLADFGAPAGTTAIRGVAAPPGNYLWVGDSSITAPAIYRVRKSDGVREATFTWPEPVRDLAWDGFNLWVAGTGEIGNTGRTVRRFDIATGLMAETFIAQPVADNATGISGLTFNGTTLLAWDTFQDLAVRFAATETHVPVATVSISRQSSSLAQRAEAEWPNVNPDSATDVGFYSPDRGTDLPAQRNEFKNVVRPGRDVVIRMGYGLEMATVFTGTIDEVRLEARGEQSQYTIGIDCRDFGWKLIDQYISDGTFTGRLRNFAKTYTNQTVEAIARDLLQMAGFAPGDITTEATGITVVSRTFDRETIADALEWCMQVSGFELTIDEQGKASFYYPTDRQPAVTNEPVTLTGFDIVPLTQNQGNFVVIGSEIVTNQAGRPCWWTTCIRPGSSVRAKICSSCPTASPAGTCTARSG